MYLLINMIFINIFKIFFLGNKFEDTEKKAAIYNIHLNILQIIKILVEKVKNNQKNLFNIIIVYFFIFLRLNILDINRIYPMIT